MSITDKFIIEDKNVKEALKSIETEAKKGSEGKNIISPKQLKYSDSSKLPPGIIHFDQLTDDDRTRRIVVKLGTNLYQIPLTKIDK